MTTQRLEPVLISGAGPTGLVLAIALRKNGVPVRIIDRLPKPHDGERGNGISPRTLELHQILGTVPKILEAAASLPLFRIYDPKDGTTPLKTFPLMPSLEPTANTPYGRYMMLGQNYHERILREYLKELGTSVEYGTELETFKQTATGVETTLIHHTSDGDASETIDAAWLVGADGAHSIVRKTLGLEFLGETKLENMMLICDFKVGGPRREFMEQWHNSAGEIVLTRPSGQNPDVLWLIISGASMDLPTMVDSREKIVEAFYRITKRRDIELGDLLSSAVYRPNIRMVKKMRVDRVFVLGDAAHCHPPSGGQGMNSSIQDATNLGWKLSMAYHGVASPGLLDSFQEERLPVIASMLDKTSELLERNTKSEEGMAAKRSTDLFQLGVNYRNSSIVLGDRPSQGLERWPAYNTESETAALPGDRAPDACSLIDMKAGTSRRKVFDILSPARHTILLFGESDSDVADFSDAIKQLPSGTTQTVRILPRTADMVHDQAFDYTLRDDEDHASTGYHISSSLSQPVAVIIRPDGIIGARANDVDSFGKYFRLIFA